MDKPPLDIAAAIRISRMAYEAASDPAAWRAVIEELVRLLGASAGGVHFRQKKPTSELWGETEEASQIWVGLEPEFEKAYMAGFWREDPWAPAVLQAQPGKVLLPEQLIPSHDLRRTRFYNDLCRHFGYFELMCGPVVNDGERVVAGAGFFRKRGQPPFGEEERQFLELVLPHLRRVTEIALRAGGGPPRLDGGAGHGEAKAPAPLPPPLRVKPPATPPPGRPGEGLVIVGAPREPDDLLDRLPVGAIAVDARGRVLRANRAARRIVALEDGLSIAVEGLRTSRASETATLRRLVALATGTAAPGDGDPGGEGGGMIVTRPSGRPSLSVTIAPVRPDSTRAIETPGAAALIYVVDPALDIETPDGMLCRLFGLTEAEARIARLVGEGRSPREAADVLGVAWNTARFQLRQVFAKTGVDRQSALARLLVLLGFARPG